MEGDKTRGQGGRLEKSWPLEVSLTVASSSVSFVVGCRRTEVFRSVGSAWDPCQRYGKGA